MNVEATTCHPAWNPGAGGAGAVSNSTIATKRTVNVAPPEYDQMPWPGERWPGANCRPALSLVVPPAWNVNSDRIGGPRGAVVAQSRRVIDIAQTPSSARDGEPSP